MLETIESKDNHYIIMDKAYEGDETCILAENQGFIPIVPPKSSRTQPWEYDKEIYKLRNEVERLIRGLKGFHRMFTRYDKLDVVFTGVVMIAMIFGVVLC